MNSIQNSSSLISPHSVTVLLIDDQLIIGEAIRRLLLDEIDIVFHFCSDPSKAIEMAQLVKPTVILQDLVMPEFDGLTLVKFFRANPKTKDVPIIVLSTKEDPRIKAEAFALGANDYIVKLPDKIELIARIRYHSNSYIFLLERNEAFKRLEESQRILNAELAEAAAYVRSLLPAPLSKEIHTDWRFIPSTQLGGDAFGYHWVDPNHFALYLLDVCGHGVGAALLSISVVNHLRSETLPHADFKDPSSVLVALNEAFQMETQNNMFFTIWYGIYNNQTQKLIYANGGHPPAILLTGDSKEKLEVKELKSKGIAIGVLPEGDFENGICTIKKFNSIYLFSDGVYELMNLEGQMEELKTFIKYLEEFEKKPEYNLDEIVAYSQEIQGKKIFGDDYSLLRVSFDI